MNYPKSGFKLGLYALALGLSGLAYADGCYIGTIVDSVVINETNATGVQADSGNGTYNCTLVSTSNGALSPITGNYWSIVNGKVNWSVPVNGNGYPMVDVDLVSVAASNGKRCNYSYANQPAGGMYLSTSDGSAAKTVTICADGIIADEPPAPPPPTPEPFTTVGDQCDATFGFNGGVDGDFDLAIGYTKDFYKTAGDPLKGYEGVAVCAKGTQRECINQCVPRVHDTACETTNGKVSLADCAPCEWKTGVDEVQYCWFYETKADLAAGTFIPNPKKSSLSAQIDVTSGSDCYTVTIGPLYGGKYKTYQQCP